MTKKQKTDTTVIEYPVIMDRMLFVVLNGLTLFKLLKWISILTKRFSILTNDSIISRSRFRIHFLLNDNTWSTQDNITKHGRNSDSSTQRTSIILIFTVEKCCIKIKYVQTNTPHADMCSSNFTKTHSV